jgi:serine protease Do
VVAIVSLVIGAASGSVFGVLAANDKLGNWLEKSVLGSSSASPSGAITPQTIQVEEDSATIDVVNKVKPAVVSVVGTQDFGKISRQPNYYSPFGDFFGFSQPEQREGKQQVIGGSGFIVTEDGLILTNKHVVDTENVNYSVVLNDGTRYDAQVLAKDPNLDIAILKIDKTGLPTVELGDSDKMQIGETVIAIGNALGEYQNSVTKGVVSGLARTIQAGDNAGNSEVIENTIQTDAAINSGNSGGPLLNLSGEVVGMNTAVSTEGQLLGFALPINTAKQDIESVKANGKIVRPYMGIRYTAITKEVQTANDLSVDYGAILVRGQQSGELAVIPGSPADKAGLEENDIILEIDGQRIDQDHSIVGVLSEHKSGDTLSLKVLHDGTEKTVGLTLGESSN